MKVRATVAVAGMVVGLGAAPSAAADQLFTDPAGDAHRALDVRRVEVSHLDDVIEVAVTVRDYADIDSLARVATQVGVHFDTDGDRTPEHLMRQLGFHIAAGSTRDWNELRANGFDPFGDWVDCIPDDSTTPLIETRPRRNLVIFSAPVSCLENPDAVRVTVRTYRPSRSRTTAEWVPGVRRYLPQLTLLNG